MRDLTLKQRERRSAILDRIKVIGPQTIGELVDHLRSSAVGIYITEDTVGKDLRDMRDAGTLWRKRGTLGGWVYGLLPGRWSKLR